MTAYYGCGKAHFGSDDSAEQTEPTADGDQARF
eukprot:CAMPEP_0168328964 /NCGR_PEP_ID=MMETSP0213-20121227/6825_1 /TAXON_ID=151035 /ORGANISM="Euplotes harpa, Strain FSP1.4" /LENGTH=32 /DNA_ID= /DNA_START= /DNA_END= /DNA_ORIENTATION=